MSRLRYFLTDSRTLAVLAVVAVGALFALSSNTLKTIAFWLLIGLIAVLIVWFCVWLVRRSQAQRGAAQVDAMLNQQAQDAVSFARPAARPEAEALRDRMLEAIKVIKTSKLGQAKGSEALYELPWYVVIGNPAAGKSSAIVNSGLRFPFSDNRGSVIQGLGGTRNCDWYFTTDGILLDTAGRYSVSHEDRFEWTAFLDLLKKNRPRAPINGLIVAASIPELTSSKPEFAIDLAKSLRQRIQEVTERLEVIAPVYVVFTKADLIAGFPEFFSVMDQEERERVWGTTLPFEPDNRTDAAEHFDAGFDELSEGLKQLSLSQMALSRGKQLTPSLLTLPMEFSAIKPALRAFIATLFEENPYQFKPVFRGFYFTSALQEGISLQHASERVATRFALQQRSLPQERSPSSKNGYFLHDLFHKVIFADRQLVRQHTNPGRTRLRYAVFFGAAIVLSLALAGWTWSYKSNQQLVANVQADLDKAVQLQKDRVDLQSRMEALGVLQDRLQQMVDYRDDHPLSLGLGLYQGKLIEAKLRKEYYAGMQQLMLTPVTASLENYLAEVTAHADQIKRAEQGSDAPAETTKAGTYQSSSPTSAEDAYNALKTYLILSSRDHLETSHLSDQLTRFWRGWLDANRGGMAREDMNRSAERLLSFYLSQDKDPDWPLIQNKINLVDDTRQALTQVMRGLPARDRVYAEIKARAATRFAPMTVASILGDQDKGIVVGSYAISGTFSRNAWDDYVKGAIKDAANKELSTQDWVLQTTIQDDLTLNGSPEHIQKELENLYKTEYAREWKKFLQGVSVAEFDTFDAAVTHMNRLGDPQSSPLFKLTDAVYQQTSWDNPSLVNAGMGRVQTGFIAWFKRVIMRRTPSEMNVVINAASQSTPPGANSSNNAQTTIPMGPIGKEFEGVGKLMVARNNNAPLMATYLESLGKIRARLNTIKNQGDPGPGARKLMQQTLGDGGSELAETLRLVDEQMLNGFSDDQRQILRPLLLRPLIQVYTALIRPTEAELNRIWNAQAYEPFQQTLAQKYPFTANATLEASSGEIGQIFGPDGAIAKFSTEALGALVVRRGNTLTPQQWADISINLAPELVVNFARWVAPLGQDGASSAGPPQTVFQIRPEPASGVTEYSVDISGQLMRYRNTPPQWSNFVWPNAEGTPGARISAVTFDGRTIEIVNFPGSSGLERLVKSAQNKSNPDSSYQLSWSKEGITVTVTLRVISNPNSSGNGTRIQQNLLGLKLPALVAITESPTAPSTSP